MRGSNVELAIGLIAVSIIEAQQADAAVLTPGGLDPHANNAVASKELHAALGQLADIDPAALKSLTLEELKALLTPEAMASLGLDEGFSKLLEVDPHAALRKLETAFRKKLAAAASSHSVASAGDHVAGDHDHLRAGDEGHHGLGLFGGIPIIWPILGIAAAGGIAAAASSGGGHHNDAPVATGDSVTTNEDTSVTFDVRANDTDKNGDALTVTQINGTAISTASPVTITGGTISLGADGRLTFVPTANYNGAPTFSYTISDGHGGTSTATVTLTVTPVNDAPVAVADTFTVAEDNAITINVRANDSDVDGDTLTVTQINGTAVSTTQAVAVTGGSVILNAAGNLVFTPTLNYNGSPSFTYTVSDGKGGIATATVSGTVTPVNDAPVAVADTFTVAEDNAITIAVRANDTDVDGDKLTVTQINGTAVSATQAVAVTGGSVILNAAGDIVFTPTLNYNGSPTFTYTVSDGNGGTSTATVSGTVTPVNDAPVAVADTFTVAEDNAITINVRANDSDVDGDRLTVTQINGTAVSTTQAVAVTGGSVILNAAGDIVFTPTLNYNGSPSFTYTVSDGNGGTATATVSGTVTPVNDAPVAVADSFTVAEDNAITINVRANDSDVDGDTLTVTQINGTAVSTTQAVAVTGGSVILNAAGNVVFTPTLNYNGSPSFTYTISDGHGGTATTTVSGTVTAVNDAPVNGVATLTLVATAGVAVTVPGLSVSDVDGDTLTTKITVGHGLLTLGAVQNGAVVSGLGTGALTLSGTQAQINASLSALTFTGTPGFSGTDTLTIATSDGQLVDTDTVTLTIGQALSGFVQDGYISGATVFFDANGNGVYDPGEVVATTDATGHYALTVNGPLTGNVVAFGGINIDTGLPNTTTLSAPAGSSVINPLTTLIAQLMGNGSGLTMAQATAQVVSALGLSPGLDLTHYDFLASGNDAAVALAVQKAAVQIVTLINQGMAAGASSDSITASLAKMIGAGTAVDLTSSANLQTILTGAGIGSTAASAAAFGAASINQVISDATSLDGVTKVVHDLNQAGVNLPPVTADDTVTTDEDHAVTFNPLANDKDPEGGVLKIVKINGVTIAVNEALMITGGAVTLGANGELTFTPAANYNGTPSFTYTVQDSGGNTRDAVVHLTVNPVNDAPVAVADHAFTGVGASVSIDVLANDSDVDGDRLTVTSVNGTAISTTSPVSVANGTVVLGADGHLIFTPGAGVVGSSSFGYTVSDGHGGVASSVVTVDTTPTGPVLATAPADFPAILANATALHAAGVTTLDVTGTGDLTISQAQAQTLIGAGLDFATADHITVTTAGTHLSTTLKGLQSLHVDAVMIAGGIAHVAAGEGLGDIAGAALPHFVTATGGDADVTLDLATGAIAPTLDLTATAATLANAGIDHLDVLGNGPVSLSYLQGQALAAAHIDFTPASDVTLNVTNAQVALLAGDASLASQLHVDHLHVTDGPITIDETQAAHLISAGLDFAATDTVTVQATGTHLSTTLKGLQDLHVDTVMIAGGAAAVTIAAGTTDLASLAAHDLPHFAAAMDVTLDIAPGTLSSGFDFGSVGAAFEHAGVDHIGVSGSGDLSLSIAQAESFAMSGLDFAPAANITLSATPLEIAAFANNPFAVAGLHIDQIDAGTAPVVITDQQATNLVEAGLHFATSDAVTVTAAGTHLSTTLKGLQDLHVDTIAVQAGVTALHIDAGDLHDVTVADLPHFDLAQTNAALDVTLRVDASEVGDILRLADALGASGVDHIAFNQPLTSFSAAVQAQLTAAAATSHLTFTQETFSTADALGTTSSVAIAADQAQDNALLYRELLTSFENAADTHGHGGALQLVDGAASSLAEAGMLRAYTAETLVVDGTTSGDKLLTTLKDIADIGVDQVKVADQGHTAPVYVDLGIQNSATAVSEIQTLFNNLDLEGHGTGSIFTGTDKVALVVDANTANALSHIDGALGHLASLGFTEVDVLATPGVGAPAFANPAIEVKLIGQDDPLYNHLHHGGG